MMKKAWRARHWHSRPLVVLKGFLCLLLVVAPVISAAAVGGVPAPWGDPAQAEEHLAMPCCDGQHNAQLDDTKTASCQHCTDDVAQSICECCSCAAPATASLHSVSAYTPLIGSDNYQPQILAAAPNAPAGLLFRPPIRSI